CRSRPLPAPVLTRLLQPSGHARPTDHLSVSGEHVVRRDVADRTPSPNWSGHLGEVMLNLFEEEENGGISQGRRWAPAVHGRLQEGADRPRPPGRDYAFGACA